MDEILFDQLVQLRNKLYDAETNNVDLVKHQLESGPEILEGISTLITKVTQAMESVRDSETTIDSEDESYSPTCCSACGKEYCVCGESNMLECEGIMSEWNIKLSREAGVYTAELAIKAKTKEEAEEKALEQAKQMNKDEWEYNEDYFQYEGPLIQVENTEEADN